MAADQLTIINDHIATDCTCDDGLVSILLTLDFEVGVESGSA